MAPFPDGGKDVCNRHIARLCPEVAFAVDAQTHDACFDRINGIQRNIVAVLYNKKMGRDRSNK